MKLIYFFFTLICLSCNKDDINFKANLFGDWFVTENFSYYIQGVLNSTSNDIYKAKFLEDGNVYFEKKFKNDTATWIYSSKDSTINILYNNNPLLIHSIKFKVLEFQQDYQKWDSELVQVLNGISYRSYTEWVLNK